MCVLKTTNTGHAGLLIQRSSGPSSGQPQEADRGLRVEEQHARKLRGQDEQQTERRHTAWYTKMMAK